jgi:ectoine hydroxylase-related dioxygenase (phytanoyl-CoA dioxygenase family)
LEFLRQSPLARCAAEVLGSERVRIFEDLLIYKSAGSEQPTPWHQDEPQWPLTGLQMGSGWFCLDPVDAQSGALRFVRASHRGPLYEPFAPPDRQSDLQADGRFFTGGRLPDIAADPASYSIASFDVEPGDVVFFHPRSLHSAIGSAPTFPRRTFSVRFLGDDVRWLPKRSVFHDWLRHIALLEGDRIDGDRFPVLWERERSAAPRT